MRVVHNDMQSHQHKMEAGVLQGSGLGPLLWNIYIYDLLNFLPSSRAYADDITISVAFASGEETAVTSHLNATLKGLEAWGHSW